MKNAAARVDALIWTLIYGGLVVAAAGFALVRGHQGHGSALLVISVVLAAVGVALIWVRSRMAET